LTKLCYIIRDQRWYSAKLASSACYDKQKVSVYLQPFLVFTLN